MELFRLSATEMAEGVKSGRFPAEDVVKSCLARMEELEPKLHAMLYIAKDQAIEDAKKIDQMIANGQEAGAMAGVPVILKDNLCTSDMPTTCSSKILEGWIPPYDATITKLLKDSGAIILGKSNLDEFAMGSSTETSAFGTSHNPWDFERTPGGSSGGSAAAVAAGYAPIAFGSDTGGSIRQPGAFCGVYGMKPSYGAVSRYGMLALASSLDQIGPFARTPEDMALAMSVIAKFDKNDSTSVERDYDFKIDSNFIKGKKIGVIKEIQEMDFDPEVKASLENTVELCKKQGASIVEISLPVSIDAGLACYYILMPAEASSNLARYDGVRYGYASKDANSLTELYFKTRKEGFGEEVKRRILTGTYVLSSGFYDAYYLTAQKIRQLIIEEFDRAFEDVDFVLSPTTPTVAFKTGEISDPIAMYMADVFTIPGNMAGLPGISFNAGFSKDGLPIGMQIVGPKWSDDAVLSIAASLGKEHDGKIAKGGN